METYDVVVIGGGATGTAIFRDVAMRGYGVALVEKSRISSGCTGKSHGNLVSGMRYVIKDPTVARTCASENKILSEIAPHLISGKNNYFVGRSSNEYVSRALAATKRLGVAAEVVDASEAHKQIPELAPDLDVIVETADRNINAEGFCLANCLSAKKNNSQLYENHTIKQILSSGENYTLRFADSKEINAKLIVNAAGAWAGKVAELVGATIPMQYNQGTIIVQNAITDRGVQHLREPSDGDAYIVHGNEAWLGTTSTAITSPNPIAAEPGAETLLKGELAEILPAVAALPTLRAFAGVRPLLRHEGTESRSISRDMNIIKWPSNAFITVVGGKLTTSRKIGQVVADDVCKYFGAHPTKCATHTELLPAVSAT